MKPSSMTVAPGSNSLMVPIVPEKRLPLWTLKGTMVLPVKSYSSKKLYSAWGRSYHQQ